MSEVTETAVVVHDHTNGLPDVGDLAINTFTGTDLATRKVVFNATENAESLEDSVGKKIMLANVIVQIAEFANEQTGVFERQPRVVLVDKDNKAYTGVSMPLYRTVVSLLKSFGEPSEWAEPLPVTVTRAPGSVKGRTFFKLSLV